MGRGLERRRVFNQNADKEGFLERFGECLERSQAQCLAWSVMSNHYHLLIRVGSDPLGQLMSPLLGGYASSYNRRHRRSGYVFQNRYKSILCDADSYLLELVRYIHLNPIKAKMISSLAELDRYAWTGHSGLMGQHERPWQQTDEVLKHFGMRLGTARNRYRAFIEAGMNGSLRSDLSGGGLVRSYGGWENIKFLRKDHQARIGDERILGDSDFVEQALKEDALQLDEVTHFQQQGWDLSRLINRVCDYCQVERESLQNKGRGNALSLAKALVCYWGTKKLGLKSTELATALGMSQPAVSKSVKRGSVYCRDNKLELTDLMDS